jgi:hypothetical protein
MDNNGNKLDGDGDGVPQGGSADKYEWEFWTVADFDPPGVMSTYPVDGQTSIGLNPDIIVNFTEPIDPDSLGTGLRISSNDFVWGNGTGPGYIPIQDFGTFTLNGATLSISDLTLQPDKTYQVTLSGNTSGGISDLRGNLLDGNNNGVSEGSVVDDYVFTFSTIDATPPEQTNIPRDTVVRIIFDDEMDESTLTPQNVSLIEAGNERPINISYSTANSTLFIEPREDLNFSKTYSVFISSMVRDVAQNLLDGNGDGVGSGSAQDDFILNFTTVPDTEPPSVTILFPEDNSQFDVGDVVRINGTATDLDRIYRLEIIFQFEDGINITEFLNETEGTWYYDWETRDFDGGVVPIKVIATDGSLQTSEYGIIVRLREPVTPFPMWIPILLTIIILIGATLSYRYFMSTYVERERMTEQKRTEVEELLKKLEEEHESLAQRAQDVETKELDLDAREEYLRDLDKHYESMAASLFARERIDLATGERIVAQEMGENLNEIKRYSKAFTLLSEAEASEAGEMTKKLPESGKKALLLVYFNALEAYLREKLRDLIPKGSTILLGEKGHINTRSRTWEEKWDTLSLGTLSHAIDHNKHFFVENEEEWEETKDLMRETVEIRNLTAHPSEANPEVFDVRDKVYSAIHSLSNILMKSRVVKK